MSMDIKDRLRQAIDSAGGIPPLEPNTVELCRDVLAEIERLEKYRAEAVRLARWHRENMPGEFGIAVAGLICDVILDGIPTDYIPPEWD
jgi:hypothetical protein